MFTWQLWLLSGRRISTSHLICGHRKRRGYWHSEENRRGFLKDLQKERNIETNDDWERIGRKGIIQGGGAAMLKYYPSWKDAVRALLPQFDLHTTKPRVNGHYETEKGSLPSTTMNKNNLLPHTKSTVNYSGPRNMNNPDLQRAVLERIAQKKGASMTSDDWKTITVKELRIEGVGGMLQQYGGKVKMLQALYPKQEWQSLLPYAKPQYYWENIVNQRLFLDEFARKRGITSQEEWKQVSARQISRAGGKQLLRYYDSVYNLLKNNYTEYNWDPNEFAALLPWSYWENEDHMERFLNFIAKKYNITMAQQWKREGIQIIGKESGQGCFKQYTGILAFLKRNYPQGNWSEFMFASQLPGDYWQRISKQREFLDYIAEEYNIKNVNDWRNISVDIIKREGGTKLLKQYPSFYEALRNVYPNEKWDVSTARKQSPPEFWHKKENREKFIKEFEQQYSIQCMEDWYRVSVKQIQDYGGGGLLTVFQNKMFPLLKDSYPDYKWDIKRLSATNKRARQRWMFLCVQRMFPSYQIVEEFWTDRESRGSRRPLELDVFIPQLQVGFEFQGIHHYHDIPKFGHVELYQQRDKEKKSIAADSNIEIVYVPYWWDDSQTQLCEFIAQSCPNHPILNLLPKK